MHYFRPLIVMAYLGLLSGCPGDDGMPPDGGCVEGEACDLDGDACTQDVCRDGICRAMGPVDCNDGDSCTADRCDPIDATRFRCRNDALSDTCLIGGECVPDGERNPSNACELCDLRNSSREWTLSSGSCDDGDACTFDNFCRDGECVGEPIVDGFEPNETIDEAAILGEIENNAEYPSGNETGTIFPAGEEDFYRFSVFDNFDAPIEPQVELAVMRGQNLTLCAYAQCSGGDEAEVACVEGSTVRFESRLGCCADATMAEPALVHLRPSCIGSNDSVDVFVRVRGEADEGVSCEDDYLLVYGDR